MIKEAAGQETISSGYKTRQAANHINEMPLHRNFAWTFLGNVIYAGCQWGMLIALAKLGSPALVGQFALGLAITAPVIMFLNLQLRTLQATDALRKYSFGEYFALRIATSVLAIMAFAGICIFSGYSIQTILVVSAVGAAKIFESLSDVFYGAFQQREQMDCIAKSMMIKGVSSLGAFSLVMFTTGSVFWSSFALMVVWGLLWACYDVRNCRLIFRRDNFSGESIRPVWNFYAMKELAIMSLPLGVVMLLVSLNANIPRYFVERNLGAGNLGIFAAIAYLMTAGGLVVSALTQSASPRLARMHAYGNRSGFRSLVLKLITLAGGIGAAGVFASLIAGKQLLCLLYKPEYARCSEVFTVLMVAAGLTYIASALGPAATARRRIKYQPAAVGAVTLVTIVTCALLVPSQGLMGAAISAVAAGAVSVVSYGLLLITGENK